MEARTPHRLDVKPLDHQLVEHERQSRTDRPDSGLAELARMSEEKMVQLVQQALTKRGVDDEVLAVGEFNPRGHTGALFAGGLVGGEALGRFGDAADAVGVAAGSLAGMHAADAASGLPAWMLIGVTGSTVYGFAGRRDSELTQLVFEVPREGLGVKVHQRVNVRVLELSDEGSGSTIELEGNRVPLTHSKDVIEALQA
jgi:hypothetical protein